MEQRKRVVIGSRKSQLAMIQTNLVLELLQRKYPDIEFEVKTMTTIGDKIQGVALSKIGEKSLFTKELEVGLESGEMDIVVHSLKDLPTTLPDNMTIAAILKREDPRDVVVMKKDSSSSVERLEDLPEGSVVGTGSVRRVAQLKAKFPGLNFTDIRGNLNTRFKKLDNEFESSSSSVRSYDAIILAAAGVIRMGWKSRISQYLEIEDCLHAVGQGAIAIESLENNPYILDLVGSLSDEETMLACIAERAFMKKLEGGCSVPVAAHASAKLAGPLIMQMSGGVWSLDGSQSLREDITREKKKDHHRIEIDKSTFSSVHAPSNMVHRKDELEMAENLGLEVAETLLERGAFEILSQARAQKEEEEA